MSNRLSSLHLDDMGRARLSSDVLDIIDRLDLVSGGGTNQLLCPGPPITNTTCSNGSCPDTANGNCTNLACVGSMNARCPRPPEVPGD